MFCNQSLFLEIKLETTVRYGQIAKTGEDSVVEIPLLANNGKQTNRKLRSEIAHKRLNKDAKYSDMSAISSRDTWFEIPQLRLMTLFKTLNRFTNVFGLKLRR